MGNSDTLCPFSVCGLVFQCLVSMQTIILGVVGLDLLKRLAGLQNTP